MDSRLIRDILKFPHNAKYIKFDDVVETIVELPGGKTQTVHSNPINFELFCVYSDEARRYEIFDDGSYAEIEVHPSLRGKVWVMANQKSQLAGQQIA